MLSLEYINKSMKFIEENKYNDFDEEVKQGLLAQTENVDALVKNRKRLSAILSNQLVRN